MPSRSKASRIAAPQLGLRGKAMSGVDLDREPEAQIGLAEADDALDFGRLERPAALRRPLRPDAVERGERAVDVGVVADAHVEHRPAPALAVVDELGDLAVGDHALGAVEQADLRHPEPDGFHGARMAGDLDHVADTDEALEEDEEPRDHVLDEALGAEAHGEPEHPRRDEQRLHVDPDLAEDHDEGDERERVADGVRHQRAERAGPLHLGGVVGGALERAQQPVDHVQRRAIGHDGEQDGGEDDEGARQERHARAAEVRDPAEQGADGLGRRAQGNDSSSPGASGS